MLHTIQAERLGPYGSPMVGAIQACVHCGFCLAACPTYGELGQEMDTPRGRIVLMKRVLEEELPWKAAQAHIDRCLGCLACEPACPSGVQYRDLINPFRALAHSRRPRSGFHKLRRALESSILPYPNRFRFAASLGTVAKNFASLIPRSIRPMLELLPAKLPQRQALSNLVQARGERRARVALLAGCVQQVLDPDINAATIDVLSRNGVEVVLPAKQGCCGGLAWHTGDLLTARRFARANLAAFPNDVDAIVTNAAGCGSTMQEYHLILRGTPDEDRANTFRRRVTDVTVFLARLGVRSSFGPAQKLKIAYHDACHLANAQHVTREPRELLRRIPGAELLEIASPHLCCGSAGTYNLDQPEIAGSLGTKKAQAVLATGAEVVASGNIGCLNQLRWHLDKLGTAIPVRHTMQVLRDAYSRGDSA
ncbi:MAG TPA: heterodisulfide reductase-related iron-sulfur binding cluster [Patescibacteria group bacterium]|nr:heterodisulfide reductase-related iron-sulfur binding cluster [Patescibacteria group bacterium]